MWGWGITSIRRVDIVHHCRRNIESYFEKVGRDDNTLNLKLSEREEIEDGFYCHSINILQHKKVIFREHVGGANHFALCYK